ncbi:MAG TPA: hypothetical protein H9697_05920 [Candidatus Mediterraneibacter faecavium]|uniref:Uncharacterized protein n=1 Tax=Candidatus Mediterraneibacter faecavium TaxID=2838668 RepID=A0A9D2TLI3_9FIRM|nr:hypothetical protein [Candidatus Mediterraneibacter faecavium]
MNYYDSELQRLQSEIMEKQRTDAKLSDLLLQQSDLEKKTEELEKTMQKEQDDVDRLNGRSLAAFFYRATGKIGEKLTKEEAEAYAASVKYEAAKNELQAVSDDIDYCQRRLSQLQDCEQQYEKVLEEKTEQIKKSGVPEAGRIMNLENEIAFLETQQKEIQEAVTAGNRALDITRKILEDLDSAKNWSTFDLMGGGLIADMAKYDRLNKVQDKIQDLQAALRGFRTELADVTERISGDLHVEIGDFLHFADYFFDGLFTDWMVYDKINDSRGRTLRTRDQIQKILGQLNVMDNELCSKKENLKEELEQAVLDS